jgi:CheY-like chemotaxis protein
MNRPQLKARVLLVDDEADFAAPIKLQLERDFQAVDYVGDEEQALAMLEKNHYDLVILDIMLHHDAGGLRLCRRLKAEPRWRNTPMFRTA